MQVLCLRNKLWLPSPRLIGEQEKCETLQGCCLATPLCRDVAMECEVVKKEGGSRPVMVGMGV